MENSDGIHQTRFDVAGTGFAALDRIYADGDLTDETLGGSCANVLISLAMLQRRVAPVLALGDDDTGGQMVDEFVQAGATIRYIARRPDVRSPVVVQELHTASGRHGFSFVCPETREDLPRFLAIDEEELGVALPMLARCSVFYADRVSGSIVDAMKAASASGASIFFEPSDVGDADLFDEAMTLATIVKYSDDRLGEGIADPLSGCVHIITHGAAGLEIRDRLGTTWCDAVEAPAVIDTCGSGDMVSIGLIDWMLTRPRGSAAPLAVDLLDGVVAGQRLAAENCAFAGARGLFKNRGAEFARHILRGGSAGS